MNKIKFLKSIILAFCGTIQYFVKAYFHFTDNFPSGPFLAYLVGVGRLVVPLDTAEVLKALVALGGLERVVDGGRPNAIQPRAPVLLAGRCSREMQGRAG